MIEEAIFIGQDGSLGLRHGRVYRIRATQYSNYPLAILIEENIICPYSSIGAFLNNWEMLNQAKPRK